MGDSCLNVQHRMTADAMEDTIRHWFVFGTSAEPRLGLVDLNDGVDDVLLNLRPEVAEKIIVLRTKFQHDLYELLKENWR